MRQALILIVCSAALLGCNTDESMELRTYDADTLSDGPVVTPLGVPNEVEMRVKRNESEKERAVQFCDFEPANAVLNGSFEFQPFESCGWSVHDTSDWGLRTTLVCDDPDHDSCALRFEPRIWGNPWIAQLFQAVRVRKGETYFICFEARAIDQGRTVDVAVIGAGEPLTIGSGVTIPLALEWRTECVQFDATAWRESSVLVFAAAGSPGVFLLDNVSLRAMD